jgi:hypothetical protein
MNHRARDRVRGSCDGRRRLARQIRIRLPRLASFHLLLLAAAQLQLAGYVGRTRCRIAALPAGQRTGWSGTDGGLAHACWRQRVRRPVGDKPRVAPDRRRQGLISCRRVLRTRKRRSQRDRRLVSGRWRGGRLPQKVERGLRRPCTPHQRPRRTRGRRGCCCWPPQIKMQCYRVYRPRGRGRRLTG